MLNFATKQAAVDFLASQGHLDSDKSGKLFFPSGTYYLAHGEYSQPDYTPRRYKDGWGIHRTSYFYSGTFYAPTDGRVDEV